MNVLGKIGLAALIVGGAGYAVTKTRTLSLPLGSGDFFGITVGGAVLWLIAKAVR